MPSQVPMPTVDESNAKKELKLLLDRVIFVLETISEHADFFVDGQHHQALRGAVGELKAKLHPHGWAEVLGPLPPGEMDIRGFTGSQGALKFGAFDQQFREMLDRIALLEARNKDIMVRIEGEEFHKKLRETPAIVRRLLGLSETALGSIKAIPVVGEVAELAEEVVGTTAAIVR